MTDSISSNDFFIKCLSQAWFAIMNDECIKSLLIIYNKIRNYYDEKDRCFPRLECIMLPFRCIEPNNVKLLVLCKEPYKSNELATGLPIEVPYNRQATPSMIHFNNILSRYIINTSPHDCIRYYYGFGVMILNTCFTTVNVVDKRYTMNLSHLSIWATFLIPFLRIMKKRQVPILLLGTEAKTLAPTLDKYDKLYLSSFPSENAGTSIKEFEAAMIQCLETYIFRVNDYYE